MRHQLTSYFDNAISVLLLIVAGITPLLFLNQTTEFYEMPKLIFLVVATLVLYGMWIFSWILKGKIVITRTPLDIPLLILLVVIIASTYFSDARFASIYGNFPRVHGSAISWVTYILLYFVTVSNLRRLAQIRTFLYVLYGSAVLVAVISLLAYFGVYLPADFTQAVNFTPTGSSFSSVAFLLLLLPVSLLSIVYPNKHLPAPLAIASAILFSITIALIGSVSTYIAYFIVVALSLVVIKPQQARRTLPLFIIPVALFGLTLALSYLPLPGGLNVLQQRQASFPREIQLPFNISWKVSVSSFRDAPFTGTGPSTYLFNFTSYKPLEFNQLNFWNFSFDTAYNEFLQILGTLGIFGLLAFITFCGIVFGISKRNLAYRTHEHDDGSNVLLPALAISGILSVILLAIHSTTLISIVVTFFMLAIFMVSQKSIRDRVMELSLGLKASTTDNKQFDLLPVIVFILFLIALVPATIRGFNIVAADYYHRLALSQANRNGTLTYQYLQRAETLNPFVDLYRVDMAQTNFALANALAAQKGPTQQNPQGSLTDRDRQTIQTLLSQAVNEGRAAVALNPLSARNWEVVASIYRNIGGVAQNALAFSLDAYGRAIQRDPLNPALRVSVGGIYYSVKNYDLAIRFFSDAANLKPDYANAYYNLAIALRDKGDKETAARVAEHTVGLLRTNPNSPDYKVANELLADLKGQIATGAESQTNQASPSSALQNVPDVNVNNLNNPPSVTPAPSVRPNPNARIPQVSPTRAPARR